MAVTELSSKINMVDVPTINPNKFLKLMTEEWTAKSALQVRPVMIWGAPGIGKTDIVEQLCQNLEKSHSKPFKFHPIILSYFNPTDLKGIPCPDVNREFTAWLKPDIFNMDPDPNVGNLLFFDEITNVATSVAQCCYQIVQKRMIATHKIPDNCYMICAGNRVGDKSGTTKMLKPLANRMRHMEFVATLKDWKRWALKQPNFDLRIISFLNYRENLLFQYNPADDNVAFPTPRSWAAVSDTTNGREISDVYELIAGDIGLAASKEFLTYCEYYAHLPNIDDIANGKDVAIPTRPDVLYALCGALCSKINQLDMTEQAKIRNILNYLLNIPQDFQFVAFYDIVKLPNIAKKVAKCQEFLTWAREYGSIIA